MAFKRYTARAQGFRANEPGCITVGASRIGLGTYKLPFEYVVIHYDKEIPAIMFTEGINGNGFKVIKDSKTTHLAAQSFTKLNLIPKGVYKRTDDKEEIFKLIGA